MSFKSLTESLTVFLKVLADGTRLDIIELLSQSGEKSAGEIERALGKSQSTISQQLKALVNADLLQVRKEGRSKYFKIKNPQIFKILSSIKLFLSNRARDRIESLSELRTKL